MPGDATGALGLTADSLTIASVGAYPVSVACCIQISDTNRIFSDIALEDELVMDEARTVLEDMVVQAIKVGFVGSTANVSAIAGMCSDYPDIPVIGYMPDLSWWQEGDALEEYLDAFEELLLPQVSVLVGNHGTLARWLLPDWESERMPTPRDIAKAAEVRGVAYVLVTGMVQAGEFFDNALASTETVIGNSKFERFDAEFMGAGETLSAALAALLAVGDDLGQAAQEALEDTGQRLGSAFRPAWADRFPTACFGRNPTMMSKKGRRAAAVPGSRRWPRQALPLNLWIVDFSAPCGAFLARTMTHTTDLNQDLLARAKRVIPGGANSPVRAFNAVGGAPRFVERAPGRILGQKRPTLYRLHRQPGPMILGLRPPASGGHRARRC